MAWLLSCKGTGNRIMGFGHNGAAWQSWDGEAPCPWCQRGIPHSHLTGCTGRGSGAGLLWYILMMFPISRLGVGRDSGPEGFTTGGSFLGFGVSFFGFGSGGGRGEAGAILVTAFINRPAKTQEKSLYLIEPSLCFPLTLTGNA